MIYFYLFNKTVIIQHTLKFSKWLLKWVCFCELCNIWVRLHIPITSGTCNSMKFHNVKSLFIYLYRMYAQVNIKTKCVRQTYISYLFISYIEITSLYHPSLSIIKKKKKKKEDIPTYPTFLKWGGGCMSQEPAIFFVWPYQIIILLTSVAIL